MLPTSSWVQGYPLECGQPTRITPLKKTGSPCPRSHKLPTAPYLGVGVMNSFPLCAKMLTGLILSQVFLREPELLWAWECSRPIVFRTKCSALVLTVFLPLLCNGLCALGKRNCLEAPFVAEPLTDILCTCSWLWISEQTPLGCTKKLLWWGRRALLIYG